jgi:hypothetical protein
VNVCPSIQGLSFLEQNIFGADFLKCHFLDFAFQCMYFNRKTANMLTKLKFDLVWSTPPDPPVPFG